MSEAIFETLVSLHRNGQSGVLCTIISSKGSTPRHIGSKMLVTANGDVFGTVGGGEMEQRVIEEAQQALAEGAARILSYELNDPGKGDPGVCGGQVEVFVEPVLAKPTLVVVGGGHVGKAVAHLAKWLDFGVIVSDDRPEFASREAVPAGDRFIPGLMSELPEEINISPQTYLVLCTRNVTIDVAGLPSLLQTPAAYIGIIGSKRRWETTRRHLLEQGIAKGDLDRVVSPMGLELNAETPEEIAVSIMAEIIMLRRGGDGRRMHD
ncbi:MAG: XdhC family protein [Anaerolineales bacterium]|nr:XdhC family protein [Anaerolineales bacterium]